MERKEAVLLLKELGDRELVQPLMVFIEQNNTNSFQLKIKGEYIQPEIELFLKNKGFLFEANQKYLIISKP